MIIEHIEYLMLRHDCVTLPGIGAILARYIPARFDADDDSLLLPPSRQLAFNALLSQSDGLIERSVSRRCGVSFEAARKIVGEEMESLRCQLFEFRQLMLGNLGWLTVTHENTISFTPRNSKDWDSRFYGLQPLKLTPVTVSQLPADVVANTVILPAIEPYRKSDEERSESNPSNKGSLSRKIIGIAASLAVVITLALFFLNPILVSNEPVKASLAPTEKTATAPEPNIKVSNPTTKPDLSVEAKAEQILSDNQANLQQEQSHEDKPRFNDNDKYCLVVASFPDATQANQYVAENPSRRLGVLHKDGRFRVYAATGATRADAEAQKTNINQTDAWVCQK